MRALALVLTLVPALLGLPKGAGAEEVSLGSGALIRVLDKMSGHVEDIEMPNGSAVKIGRLRVSLGECRFPEGNPAGDSYAFLTVTELGRDRPVFIGWMVGSSPALSAMDHPRYDVWVIRCTTE